MYFTGHYIDPRLSECLHHINSSPAGENPSCLQTTAASCASQSRSQIVPHLLLKHISTLPSCSFVPLTSRTPNVKHGIGDCVVVGGDWPVGWLVTWLIGWMVGCVVGWMGSCMVSWIGNWVVGVGVICGGATVVGHTRTSRLTVVDPRKSKNIL